MVNFAEPHSEPNQKLKWKIVNSLIPYGKHWHKIYVFGSKINLNLHHTTWGFHKNGPNYFGFVNNQIVDMREILVYTRKLH